ncbi:unnamed protein product [Adineta steineri]|uniref:Uncharacterized protein n=1 Tax=Adineta steineri TaxID=433720 RepID=A0A818NBY8_9BILA|nr:unnamed protein product [Adineta steineri]CAF3602371.1 unnamed protein product [Adineta steineri]
MANADEPRSVMAHAQPRVFMAMVLNSQFKAANIMTISAHLIDQLAQVDDLIESANGPNAGYEKEKTLLEVEENIIHHIKQFLDQT